MWRALLARLTATTCSSRTVPARHYGMLAHGLLGRAARNAPAARPPLLGAHNAAAGAPRALRGLQQHPLHQRHPAAEARAFAAWRPPPRRRQGVAARSGAQQHGGAPRHGGIDEALKRLAVEQLGSEPSVFATGEGPTQLLRRICWPAHRAHCAARVLLHGWAPTLSKAFS